MPLSFSRPSDPSRYGTGAILKALIWLFSALLIVAGWLAASQQIGFEREQALAEAIAQNQNRAIAFEQYVRRTLEVASLATRYVADRVQRGQAGAEFAGTPERPAILAGSFARSNPTFLALVVTDAQGNVIAATRALPQRFDLSRFESFRIHAQQRTEALFVGRPFRSPTYRRDAILLSRRLSNPDGSFAGIVALLIAPEQFTAFFRDARVGPQDVISLIGLDGITRARRTGAVASSGEDLRGRLVMQMQMRNPNGTYIGPSALDGIVRIFSHRRLTGYPLFATYGVLEADVLAQPQRRARVLIASVVLGTLATLGFAVALTLLINRGERRAAEMTRANLRLEEAQRIGQIGDWTYDLGTGAIYWSPQLCRQFERTPEQGSPTLAEFKAYLTDDGRAAVGEAHAEAIRTGETREVEYEVRLPSGAVNRHQGWVIPTFDATGKVTALHGTDQNISGRKLLEQLETRVAHLSRIEAMNAMATTLAHELNQPLAAAANYLAGSRHHLEGRVTDPGAREGLAAAEQQIHFAADIIRRLREMVANQPRANVSFNLSAAIDDALALTATSPDSRLPKVVKQLAPDARQVRADRVQVQQVLINLLRNAFDATGGSDQAEIAVTSGRTEGGMIMISVIDNGRGFSQPIEERFSPFVTKADGMGLGLSISRTIVESHGGRIWTEDRPSGGAIVHFTLPRATEPPGARDGAKADTV